MYLTPTIHPWDIAIPTRPFHGRGHSGVSGAWGLCITRTIPPCGGTRLYLLLRGCASRSHTPTRRTYFHTTLPWPGHSGASAAWGLCLTRTIPPQTVLGPIGPCGYRHACVVCLCDRGHAPQWGFYALYDTVALYVSRDFTVLELRLFGSMLCYVGCSALR